MSARLVGGLGSGMVQAGVTENKKAAQGSVRPCGESASGAPCRHGLWRCVMSGLKPIRLGSMNPLCTLRPDRKQGIGGVCAAPRHGVKWRCHQAGVEVRTSGSGRFLLEALDGLEHVLDVAGDLDAAPLFAQHAVGADQEGGAFYTLDLLAVHDLVLDHTEHVAKLFFCVG